MKYAFWWLRRLLVAVAVTVAFVGFCAIVDSWIPYSVWLTPNIEGIVSSDSLPVTVVVSRNDVEIQRVVTDHQGQFRIEGQKGAYSRLWFLLGGDLVMTSKVQFVTDSGVVGVLEIGLEGSDLDSDDTACDLLIRAEAVGENAHNLLLTEEYVSARYRAAVTDEDYRQIKQDFLQGKTKKTRPFGRGSCNGPNCCRIFGRIEIVEV